MMLTIPQMLATVAAIIVIFGLALVAWPNPGGF